MKLKIGRCKLNSILKTHGMLVQKKRKSVITTNSRHRFRKYPNIIKGVEISKPEQVWVADITYIRTNYGFNYLHLITDAYSKQIVGFCYQKLNMHSFRKIRVHRKWQIRLHNFSQS